MSITTSATTRSAPGGAVKTLRRPRLGSHGTAVAAAQRFADEIAGDAIERDRSGRLPVSELAAFDASGLLAITIPDRNGGPDLPVATLADVVRTIAAADWLAVTALDPDDRLVLAFVARDAPGVTLTDDWDVLGQRATVSGSVEFDGVEIDPELIVPYWSCFERPQQLGARAQLYHASIQVGIAAGALRDARWFVCEKARPFFEASRAGWADTAAEDPYVIYRFGALATQVRAAEALLAQAAGVLDEVGRVPADADEAARGSTTVAQAKAFASEVAATVSSQLFSLAGASAADERYDLSRHWRNARTHAGHDPVDWKYHHVGNYLLRGVLPPNHGQL